MTFSYSGNPASSLRDAVRFHAQDTDYNDQLLADEEIDFLISSWSHFTDSPIYLAALACESIAAKFTRELSYGADGVSVNAGELQQKYQQLASQLREMFKTSNIPGAPDVGGVMVGEVYDQSIKPLTFAKGMHDNIEAGQQDYGGTEEAQYIQPEIDYH